MNLSVVSRRCRTSAAVLFLAAIAGCSGSGVSQSNYDKVQTGMTQGQVEGFLGTDKEQTNSSMATPGMSVAGVSVPSVSAKVLTWHDGAKTITVTFKDGQVVGKAENGL